MLDRSQLSYLPGSDANTDESEIAKFNQLAEQWWDPKGKFKRVLDFNTCRWQVIERQIRNHFKQQNLTLNEMNALDIGCGGGLLCEPLAKSGVKVTGIDASEMSIKVARQHAMQSRHNIEYLHCLSHELVTQKRQFDIVLNTEVIEHVPDQQRLIRECSQLLKPGGLLILATLNRTLKSYLFGIVGAEYILRLLPIGTHSWRAFVKPEEMETMLDKCDCRSLLATGVTFNPFSGIWRETPNLAVNYLLFAEKKQK